MPLPKIAIPSTRETLPDSGEKIKIRPMVGQEFEILLAAKESKDENTMIESTFDVLDSIVTEPPSFNARDLSPLDFDFLFTRLMVMSYGKSDHDLEYVCKNMVDGKVKNENDKPFKKQCGGSIKLSINLDKDVVYEKPEKVENELDVDGRYKIILSNIRASDFILSGDNMFSSAANIIERLVDTQTDEEWKFQGNSPDVTKEEALDFTKHSLSSTVLKKVGDYINSSGNMTYEGKKKCPKCGHMHTIKLKGFIDFFTSASVDIT